MAALDTFPISFKVAGRCIVVVGGGLAALNKTRLVLKTSAKVAVWARAFDPGFRELAQDRLTLHLRADGLGRADVPGDWLADAALVFVADGGDDGDFAEAQARAAGIPVNVVDHPEACDFYTPAIVDRAPVTVAVMTEGAAPVIGRRVRAAVEAALPPQLGAWVELAGSLRAEVAARLPEGAPRRRFYERLADSAEIEAIIGSDPQLARRLAFDLLDTAASGAEPGAIAWVGAGPGAEDLLTLRAQRLLQSADVIVHDAATPLAIIDMGRRDAERIALDSGRSRQDFAESASLLIGLVEDGKRVVRLVAGDVRDAECAHAEIAAAHKAGIFATIVPGIADAVADADSGRSPATQRVA